MAGKWPIALDAMGGDRAPSEIVSGGKRAVSELGLSVILVGDPNEINNSGGPGSLPVIPASEVIAMDEDPAKGVRTKKDSSLVRCAEAVRDGKAMAMVSAGNTGAAMASALFRMGRLSGVSRPAIASPLPIPGHTPTVLLDSGANAECQAEWLVQFAQMGAVFSRVRYDIERPRVALLSIGEESTKGSPLVKETHKMLAALGPSSGFDFIGNVEGRDLLDSVADVIVTDGFTGNVALKTLEGGLKFVMKTVLGAMSATDEAKAAAEVLLPYLLPVATELDPETTGGAMLLGVDGVCIISHGSSSATAVINALKVADELVERDIVAQVAAAIKS
ncbi:MAG: phosphate acyltransferase PlsX [Acidimicrobiales bacterium]|nr:phosphate acyltransferase PlsX [Acidimicrobiales bacterium]